MYRIYILLMIQPLIYITYIVSFFLNLSENNHKIIIWKLHHHILQTKVILKKMEKIINTILFLVKQMDSNLSVTANG